jgi:hemoglobin/transferrin/lactoferrin receptor protein
MKLQLFLFLLLLPPLLTAQRTEVVVLDAASGEPLSGVEINSEWLSQPVFSDRAGKANLQSGKTYWFEKEGYATLSSELPTSSSTVEIKLSAQKLSLPEVVVSAGRLSENSIRVLQPIQVIDRRVIERGTAQTTPELLEQSGQVFVQRSQAGGGSIVMRGFEANRVLLVIDGIRMNNAIYRAGHLQNAMTIDQQSLRRIEVINGPGTVTYGSDALGGVVHLRTLSPVLNARSAGAFVRYGSANQEKTVSAHLQLGNNRWAVASAFTFSDFEDVRSGTKGRKAAWGDWGLRKVYQTHINGVDTMMQNDNVYQQRGSAYSQADGLLKVLYRPSGSVSHLLNVQMSTSSNLPRYDRLSEMNNTQLRFGDWYYGPQDRKLVAYQLLTEKPTILYDRLSMTASYQDVRESRHTRNFKAPNRTDRFEKVDVYGFLIDMSKQIKRHDLRYGLETQYNNVASTARRVHVINGNQTSASTRYPDGGSQTSSLAAYLRYEIMWAQQLLFQTGIRINAHTLTSTFVSRDFYPLPFDKVNIKGMAPNGSLGIIHQPQGPWRKTLLFSSGYRFPNVDDVGKVFDSTPGAVIVPNKNLQAEYAFNAEVQMRYTAPNRFYIEGGAFYTRLQNALQLQAGQFNGIDSILYDGTLSQVLLLSNVKAADVRGLFARAEALLIENLTISGFANYTRGTFTDGVPLDHVPPFFGQLRLSYTLTRFEASLWWHYNAAKPIDQYNPNGEDNLQYALPSGMPAWQTLNLSLGYKLYEELRLRAGVNNMLDQHYRVFMSGISAPGRHIWLSIGYTL